MTNVDACDTTNVAKVIARYGENAYKDDGWPKDRYGRKSLAIYPYLFIWCLVKRVLLVYGLSWSLYAWWNPLQIICIWNTVCLCYEWKKVHQLRLILMNLIQLLWIWGQLMLRLKGKMKSLYCCVPCQIQTSILETLFLFGWDIFSVEEVKVALSFKEKTDKHTNGGGDNEGGALVAHSDHSRDTSRRNNFNRGNLDWGQDQ